MKVERREPTPREWQRITSACPVVRRMARRRQTICILDQAPDPETVFVTISRPVQRNYRPPNLKSITIPCQATVYPEEIS